MKQHHDAADHVLCVISDDYLKAPYSAWEFNAALWQRTCSRYLKAKRRDFEHG
jgi:hypothetical protein